MAKQSILQRMTLGRSDQPDFTPNKLPGTRMAQFWDIFKTKTGILFKLNLLTVLFCVPAIIWLFYIGLLRGRYGTMLPFDGNIGIGYPIAEGVQSLMDSLNFSLDVQLYAVLVPLIMVATVGFAGLFYTIKQMSWGQNIRIFRDFFLGIKKNFLQFIVVGFVIGIVTFILMFNIMGYNQLDLPVVLRVVGIIITIIIAIITLFAVVFLTTQSVTYKISIARLFKNSYIFALGLLPQNLMIIVAGIGPIAILLLLGILVPFLSLIVYMVIFFLGLSYLTLVFTQYSHYIYDKFLNPKIVGVGTNNGLYTNKEEKYDTNEIETKTKIKKPIVKYDNPKKNKLNKKQNLNINKDILLNKSSKDNEKEEYKQKLDILTPAIGVDDTSKDTMDKND